MERNNIWSFNLIASYIVILGDMPFALFQICKITEVFWCWGNPIIYQVMLSYSVIIEYYSICWAMLDIVTKRKSGSLGPIHIKQINVNLKFPIELESEIEYMLWGFNSVWKREVGI